MGPVGLKRILFCGLGMNKGMNLKLFQSVYYYDLKICVKFQAISVNSFSFSSCALKTKEIWAGRDVVPFG